jgi:hypothetical protein
LIVAASKVKIYVDEHIAHAEASAVATDVTLNLNDIHAAIDVVGDLFKRYYSLLTASSFGSLVPVIQHDWKAVFREPWLRVGP